MIQVDSADANNKPLRPGPTVSPTDARPETVVVDDEQLLRRQFAEDPKKGCEILFRRYYTNLCNHAIRYVYAREAAEDIVSEVFTNFWQSRVFEQITTSYRAYLYKAVRNRAYNYVQWELKRTDPIESVPSLSADRSPEPDAVLQYHELSQKIERVIQELPPQCRRAFVLKRIEGKTYTEIAAEMQLAPKSVESLVSRALTKLRQALKEDWLPT